MHELLTYNTGAKDVLGSCPHAHQCDVLLPLQDDDEHWEKLWVGRWGALAASNRITQRAVKLAGGWKKLFRSKAVQDQASTPWVKACPHEVQVGSHPSPHAPSESRRRRLHRWC